MSVPYCKVKVRSCILDSCPCASLLCGVVLADTELVVSFETNNLLKQ